MTEVPTIGQNPRLKFLSPAMRGRGYPWVDRGLRRAPPAGARRRLYWINTT